MASSAEIPSYKHESLPDPGTFIRLLQICSVDEARDVPVHCELTAWAVDTAPTYTAISYTWGEPNPLELILVDGKRMEVRQNCAYVLRQAWRLKGNGYIWIDAICINQSDNDEKSHQVAMMGSVYQKAVQTLACVGHHENDSEFLYEMLRKKSHWWSHEAFDSLCFGFYRCHLWEVLLRNSTKARLLKAFNSFLERQYFLRVWIYQELFFGRAIQICCENENAEISMLWQLHTALRVWSVLPRMRLRRLRTEFDQFRGQAPRIDMVLKASAVGQHRAAFRFMTTYVSNMQCEEPRDRVYSTLAVVDWEGMQPIEPDYSRDRFDLALEVLRRLGESLWVGQWFWLANIVAKSLLLTEEPSNKLNDAIQERLLLSSSNVTNASPQIPGEGHIQNLRRFWGNRLLLNNATWEFDRNTLRPASGWPYLQRREASDASIQGVFPKILKRSKGSHLDLAQADILLPGDAQSQDWLLVPSPYGDRDDDDDFTRGFFAAFLAREGGDHQLHLISKVLIFPERLWPQVRAWKKFWGKDLGSVKYGVHLDAEDALLLAHSCNWAYPPLYSIYDGKRRGQFAEKYFETRLCGGKSCSYAVPMDF